MTTAATEPEMPSTAIIANARNNGDKWRRSAWKMWGKLAHWQPVGAARAEARPVVFALTKEDCSFRWP